MLRREPYGFLDAVVRYARAREHVAEVQCLLEAFKATPQDVGTHIEAQSLEELLRRKRFDLRDVPIPHTIPVRIGEAVYNLRCALDYLVFALAWHDDGREPTGDWARWLQFPCESDIEVFKRRRPTLLKGVSDEHVATIREYQPACGCKWLQVLVLLSDSDKHRHLALLGGSFDVEGATATWIHHHPNPDAVADEIGTVEIADVNMHDRATLDVVFPDGHLVSETMQQLEAEVRALLLRFAPEFRLRPVE